MRRDILGAIIRTIGEEGRTVLFSSHLLDEVERVADRVAIIHPGRILMAASMDEIKETHRRVTLRFDQTVSVAQPPTLVGSLTQEGSGSEWTYVCNGESEQLRFAAQALGATVVSDTALRYTALVFRSGSESVGRAPRLPTAAALAAQRRITGAWHEWFPWRRGEYDTSRRTPPFATTGSGTRQAFHSV